MIIPLEYDTPQAMSTYVPAYVYSNEHIAWHAVGKYHMAHFQESTVVLIIQAGHYEIS